MQAITKIFGILIVEGENDLVICGEELIVNTFKIMEDLMDEDIKVCAFREMVCWFFGT